MSTIDTRREQMFPKLQPREIDRLRRFGEGRRYSAGAAFVDVHAIDEVEALLIPCKNLRALMIEEPELGERIMRALILRRVALVEAGAGGPGRIGDESSPDG